MYIFVSICLFCVCPDFYNVLCIYSTQLPFDCVCEGVLEKGYTDPVQI